MGTRLEKIIDAAVKACPLGSENPVNKYKSPSLAERSIAPLSSNGNYDSEQHKKAHESAIADLDQTASDTFRQMKS